MVTAFAVSMLIIKGLMAFIKKHSFTVFGWYRIALGILVLVLGAVGIIGK
jgi:undecaprenyl-diphosphatase